jgi:signal transduction histidine kinase
VHASLTATSEVPVLVASLRQQLTLARGDSERLLALLDDVLQYEQLRSGDLRPRIEPLDLVALSREALAALEARAERQQVVLLPQWGATSLPVLGDARQLAQVLTRLLTDAIDASPAGGDVQLITATTPQGEARVAVVDSGPRPTADFIERAFDAFPAADDEDGMRTRGGNGLTLALCRGLLEQLGARVGIEPAPMDGGANLWFSLPLRVVAQQASAPAASPRKRARY